MKSDQRAELRLRKNAEFDGEARLTNDELESLLADADALAECRRESSRIIGELKSAAESRIRELLEERDAAQARERVLREELLDIGKLAEAHHCEQPGHLFLHALTVDIPARVEAALNRSESNQEAAEGG